MNRGKEYLNQIRDLDSRIRMRQQEIEWLRESAMISNPNLDANKIRTESPDPDPLSSVVSNYVDMEKDVAEMLVDLARMKHKVIGQIERLGEAKYMDVLYKRYVELKPFIDVAEEMNYSIQHVFRIHGQALKLFNRMFEFKDEIE